MDKKQRPSYLVSIEEQTDESKSLLETVQENSTVRGTQNVHDSVQESHFRKENDFMVSEQKTPLNEAQEEKEDEEIDLNPTPYEKASFLNILHYFYVLKSLWRLRKKRKLPLTLDDTPRIGKTEEVNHKINSLEAAYLNYHKTHKEPSLFWPMTRVFWVDMLKQQTLMIISWAAKILSAFFLSKLLGAIEDGQRAEAYKWTLCLFGAVIVNLYTHHVFFFTSQRSLQQLKLALIGLMYRKISRLSFYSINQVSIGKIINIAANDLNSFEFYASFTFCLLAAPFALAASLAILWSFFGVASLTGIVFVILLNPIQGWISKIGAKYVSQKNSVTDERVKLTNEMIEGIRPLKMYGWNMKYTESIMKTRNQEVGLLTKIGYTDFFGSHLLPKLSPALASFLMFLVYGLMGGTLKTSQVYSTIILVSFLRIYLVFWTSLSLRFITETKLVFDRIIQLLEVEERDPALKRQLIQPQNDSNAVEFEDFSAYWGEQSSSVLKNLNFSVKKGSLCAIIGRIGSGKTTTLLSFLNEIPKTTGELRYSGSIAYVEQAPSIYPGTLRSNILFGKPYDEQKYNRVVEAACLIDDFKGFANGDLTEIGERGANLSGGQKARTSLARALYSDADIYLLDDPLSAVDSKVAKNMFHKAIRGLLKNKTVLLVTHQVHFAKEVEKIVLLENGEVLAEGTLDEIIRQDAGVMSIFEAREKPAETRSEVEQISPSLQDDLSPERRDETSPLLPKRDDIIHLRTVESIKSDKLKLSLSEILIDEELEEEKEENMSDDITKERKGQLISEEKDESSKVGWGTYWFYLKNAGSCSYILVFILNLSLIEVLFVMYSRLLGYWTQGTWTPIFAMKVLGIILFAFFLFLVLREVLYVHFGLNVSKKLHNKTLHNVAGAKIEFFDTNLSGRILNRFSNDLGVLDRFLLQVQDEVLDCFFFFMALLITLCVIFPWIFALGIILILALMVFFRYCKNFIIQGRGLELLTRSPVYSWFSLTLNGLTSIRVYGQENRFIKEFIRLLNRNTRAYNFYYDIARTFSFYCDLQTGAFVCVGITILISLENIDASLVGLGCFYFLSYNDQIQRALRQTLTHIMQMASTERIRAYTEIPQEPPMTLPSDELLKQGDIWPSRGKIQFHNVYMKYRENTEHVLKGLTITIHPGEKIGCVGRTGAGKTSILQVLFRLSEIDRQAVPDSSITIDGVEISKIGLEILRTNLTLIPQTSFILTGTVRKNLDPLGKYKDERLAVVLQEVGLWDRVRSLPDGLNTVISDASSSFSTGEKQLLCLARALLQNSKIVVLDEATANVDFETDNFIQQKIMEKFHDSTVFTIAHRLSTIANYDRVMVMDKGRVREFDHPYKLLVKNIGDDSITNTDGLFASMILHTGAKHSEVVFQTAKNSYFRKFGKQEKKSVNIRIV